MDLKTAKETLMRVQDKASAFGHAIGLLSFDGETAAPPKTALNRAHALGILSEEIYKLTTDEQNVEVLEFLDAHSRESPVGLGPQGVLEGLAVWVVFFFVV